MNVNVLLEPGQKGTCEKTVIIIDVLRATSSIVTALANGASSVEAVGSVTRAREMKKDDPDLVITGERGSIRPEGFDLGNSPLEFTSEKVKGKRVVITTTNGTRAIEKFAVADSILLAALLNIDAVTRQIVDSEAEVTVVCAGTNGVPSIEDVFCAGALANGLIDKGYVTDDSARIALATYYRHKEDTGSLLKKESGHGRYLDSIGLGDDTSYCAKMNLHDLVPISLGQRIFVR